jgi:PiT family inorganic phosphate transporter
MRQSIKAKFIFKSPNSNNPPPFWIRLILLLTCTGVSFSHGSNDGQKGVGLIMLILISIAPMKFAMDSNRDLYQMEASSKMVLDQVIHLDNAKMNPIDRAIADQVKAELFNIRQAFDRNRTNKLIPESELLGLRKDIIFIGVHIKKLKASGALNSLSKEDLKKLDSSVKEMKSFTEYAPNWVILIISLSLGLGTMIGWKRIVVTIGEKIGKENLTYAQGASAGILSALTIGVASYFGSPVSTTQVLSSGVAGSMVSSNGFKNLQGGTIRNIAIAWLLTLPVTMLLSGGLFMLFRFLF